MCQRTYSLPTSKGLIEVTKGTYLTFNKRQQNRTRSLTDYKKIRTLKPVVSREGVTKASLQIKRGRPIRAIARRISLASSTAGSLAHESQRMEEESTWSSIERAVYGMSLSLSAANYDLHYN